MAEEGFIERLQRRLEQERGRYEERGRIYKIAWVTAALIVILAGLAMTVVPGPATVVIPIGLAMLSLQFAWAQRVLDKSLETGMAARDRAAEASREQKILAAAALAAGIAAVAVLAAVFLL